MRAFILSLRTLNMLSGCVGGLWLLYLGYWKVVLGALAISGIVATALPFVLGLALIIPGLVTIPFTMLSASSRNPVVRGILSGPMTFVTSGIVATLQGAWSVLVFAIIWKNTGPEAIIPAILCSYSTSVACWHVLAAQDVAGGGGEASAFSSVIQQFACIALTAYVYLNRDAIYLDEMIFIFGVPALIGVIFWTLIVAVGVAKTPRMVDA